jgi:hypothetical protein
MLLRRLIALTEFGASPKRLGFALTALLARDHGRRMI